MHAVATVLFQPETQMGTRNTVWAQEGGEETRTTWKKWK
jgi:hypothetical protein